MVLSKGETPINLSFIDSRFVPRSFKLRRLSAHISSTQGSNPPPFQTSPSYSQSILITEETLVSLRIWKAISDFSNNLIILSLPYEHHGWIHNANGKKQPSGILSICSCLTLALEVNLEPRDLTGQHSTTEDVGVPIVMTDF